MFIIHSKPGCPWCDRAVELLNAHNLPHLTKLYKTSEEITDFKAKGFKTFPQIYNEQGDLIGGFTDLQYYLSDDDF